MPRLSKSILLPIYPKQLSKQTEERVGQMEGYIKDLSLSLVRILQKIINATIIEEVTTVATPILTDFEDGEIKLYVNGATKRIYCRIQGVLYYVNLTAV